jgi:hypothetical protein
MGETWNAYRIIVGKPSGRPQRRSKDGINMDLREIGCDDRNGIELAEDVVQCCISVSSVGFSGSATNVLCS